jgi:hypothetical protein
MLLGNGSLAAAKKRRSSCVLLLGDARELIL